MMNWTRRSLLGAVLATLTAMPAVGQEKNLSGGDRRLSCPRTLGERIHQLFYSSSGQAPCGDWQL